MHVSKTPRGHIECTYQSPLGAILNACTRYDTTLLNPRRRTESVAIAQQQWKEHRIKINTIQYNTNAKY
jgi:hypothetical protein